MSDEQPKQEQAGVETPKVIIPPPRQGRPAFSEIYMDLAFALSRRSTCRRLQVGCVVSSADHRYIYGVGYNGNAATEPNDCDKVGPKAVGACGCLHSEMNAIINCAASRTADKHVYVTHQPCLMCAKALVNMGGVRKVFYAHPYRLHEGVELLERASIVLVALGGYP